MKKLVFILLPLFFAVIFQPAVFAASSKTRQITGNVTAIDTKTRSITVTKKSREVTLSIEENTKIIMCTPKTAITDIKIGDKVTTKYKETGDKNSAKSITIRETVEKVIKSSKNK